MEWNDRISGGVGLAEVFGERKKEAGDANGNGLEKKVLKAVFEEVASDTDPSGEAEGQVRLLLEEVFKVLAPHHADIGIGESDGFFFVLWSGRNFSEEIAFFEDGVNDFLAVFCEAGEFDLASLDHKDGGGGGPGAVDGVAPAIATLR